MQPDKLTALSVEELRKKQKQLSAIVTGIGIVMLILVALGVYLALSNNRTNITLFMPVILLPALLPSVILLNNIKKALKAKEAGLKQGDKNS